MLCGRVMRPQCTRLPTHHARTQTDRQTHAHAAAPAPGIDDAVFLHMRQDVNVNHEADGPSATDTEHRRPSLGPSVLKQSGLESATPAPLSKIPMADVSARCKPPANACVPAARGGRWSSGPPP